MGITSYKWVLLVINGFYQVLLGFTGFYRVFKRTKESQNKRRNADDGVFKKKKGKQEEKKGSRRRPTEAIVVVVDDDVADDVADDCLGAWQICDDGDEESRHPIENAIDGTNSWWQSPSLQNGRRFEWVTISLDLKKVRLVLILLFLN